MQRQVSWVCILSDCMGTINIYDCGCVLSRPHLSSCNNYGTRWRAYLTKGHIKLRCRDCGKIHTFEFIKVKLESEKHGRTKRKTITNI